jgi:stage V sporulation protein B
MFGLLKGLVIPVLFFPAVFISAFSRLLMPEFADARAVGDDEKIKKIGAKVVQSALIFSILVTGIFMIFSKDLGNLIFKSPQAGEMLFLLAPLVPLMYLDGIVDGMLKGLNEQVAVMKYNIIEAAMRVGLVYFIIPLLGFDGFMLTIYVGNIVNSMMSLNKFIKVADIKFSFSLWIIRPLLSVFAAGFPIYVLFKHFINIEFPTVLCIILTIIFYVVFIFLTGCVVKEDIIWILDKSGITKFIKTSININNKPKADIKSFLKKENTLKKSKV